MNKRLDRYINNDLISYISPPQYENSCSFTALTAVFNYLYAEKTGIKTSNELAKAIGIGNPKDITGYGNATLMKFFDKLCRYYRQSGSCGYFLRAKDVQDFANNAEAFGTLKTAIKNPDTALIYHLSNHYNIVVGYFEHAENPDDAFVKLSKEVEKEVLSSLSEEELPWMPEGVIIALVKHISDNRKSLSAVWTDALLALESDIPQMDVSTANQLQNKVTQPPAYVTDTHLKKIDKLNKALEKRLSEIKIEWLIEKFNELSDKDKVIFRSMLA